LKINRHLDEAGRNLTEKTRLSEVHQKEIQKIKDEMAKTHRLYLADQISVEGLGQIVKPAEERLGQLQIELPKLEAEVDFLRVNKLSADDVIRESTDLYARWPSFAPEGKRKIVEALIEKVVVGNGEIDITFSCMPSSEDVCKSQQRLGLG
jgi:site-specific DNA recombinase